MYFICPLKSLDFSFSSGEAVGFVDFPVKHFFLGFGFLGRPFDPFPIPDYPDFPRNAISLNHNRIADSKNFELLAAFQFCKIKIFDLKKFVFFSLGAKVLNLGLLRAFVFLVTLVAQF